MSARVSSETRPPMPTAEMDQPRAAREADATLPSNPGLASPSVTTMTIFGTAGVRASATDSMPLITTSKPLLNSVRPPVYGTASVAGRKAAWLAFTVPLSRL